MIQRVERAARTIAALPADDWQPEHWDAFEAARKVLAEEVARIDRREKLKAESSRTDQYRRRKAKELREWQKVRRFVQGRSDGRCEARCAPSCAGRGEHAHHQLMRSQGGADDPSNLLWVCRPCHDWIHQHPADSYAAGWLIRSTGAA